MSVIKILHLRQIWWSVFWINVNWVSISIVNFRSIHWLTNLNLSWYRMLLSWWLVLYLLILYQRILLIVWSFIWISACTSTALTIANAHNCQNWKCYKNVTYYYYDIIFWLFKSTCSWSTLAIQVAQDPITFIISQLPLKINKNIMTYELISLFLKGLCNTHWKN